MSSLPTPPPPRRSSSSSLSNNKRYYPSIFQYTCRGALELSSSQIGSAGVCRGIATKLEHVRDLQPCTRQEATDAFCYSNISAITDSSSTSNATTNSDQMEKVSLLLQTQALIYNEEEEEQGTQQPPTTKKEQEAWHEWSCYGSTLVNLLVLRPIDTNDKSHEAVVGVAPECKLGVSIRDMGAPKEGGGVVATVRAGPLEVNFVGDYYNDDEEEEEEMEETQQEYNQQQQQQQQKQQPQTLSRRSSSSFQHRFAKASGRVWDAMKQNASFVHAELSDNFLERSQASASRIVAQLPKTLDRTTRLMGQVYQMWRNDNDDNDNE